MSKNLKLLYRSHRSKVRQICSVPLTIAYIFDRCIQEPLIRLHFFMIDNGNELM